tara:strand:+ start:4443 stop:4943 length:501 start_codon:yes stop_codon:yes gene_type:complete
MENDEKINFLEKVKTITIENKKILISIIILIFLVLASIKYYDYNQKNQNKIVSEKFIQAGIYLSSNENEKAKDIFEEIILSKNKFYSLLALNEIIDNELKKNEKEILRLFEVIESIKVETEQKNLIKLKKALYLMKISKDEEGKKLLNEIISEGSVWKDTATEILK